MRNEGGSRWPEEESDNVNAWLLGLSFFWVGWGFYGAMAKAWWHGGGTLAWGMCMVHKGGASWR